MSLAEETRAAVRARPFLYDALRAGVVNYAAAARTLDVGEDDAVTAALRRYADELTAPTPFDGSASVSMRSGLGPADGESEALFHLAGTAYGPGGSSTGVLATGDVDARLLEEVLGRLRTADVACQVAAAADDALLVLVSRRDGPTAVRVVEAAVGRSV
ncbi:DUF7523 family protein [Halomarina ordinaria]|uniref:Arginine repressor n=1 Tax=Halomarina ordinaria TaxID=3033939 RepID=A0ABD5U653_9EURY|nr:hypothetical protein [Halomarina sp. PSRA2]